MSTPQKRIAQTHIPPVTVRERAACMCASGGSCSIFAPGHALHLIQTRLVAATPSEWIDAIVESADDSGTVALRGIADGAQIVVWSGAGATKEVAAGTPVALHGRYHVLAVGDRWFNVLSD